MTTASEPIREAELRERIESGQEFRLVLEWDVRSTRWLMLAQHKSSRYSISKFRGGQRVALDVNRAMEWAEGMGMKGILLERDFA